MLNNRAAITIIILIICVTLQKGRSWTRLLGRRRLGLYWDSLCSKKEGSDHILHRRDKQGMTCGSAYTTQGRLWITQGNGCLSAPPGTCHCPGPEGDHTHMEWSKLQTSCPARKEASSDGEGPTEHSRLYELQTHTHTYPSLSQINTPARLSGLSNTENKKIQLLFHYYQSQRLSKSQGELCKWAPSPASLGGQDLMTKTAKLVVK